MNVADGALTIPSRIRDYEVRFEGSFEFFRDFEALGERQYVVDAEVLRLYPSLFAGINPARVTSLPAVEDRKTLGGVMEIYDALIARAAKKNMTLVCVGGGILQDVGGFAASTLYRGIPWVYVPTTLLAQADSCIGGKTSLNYKTYKNLLGTFYPPRRIHIAPQFLKTLTEGDFLSGLGEVIKLHVMGGADLTENLVRALPKVLAREPGSVLEAVRASLDVKVGYITEDEFDGGRRNMLNFGHCFGHALESTSGFFVPHGQAVTLGIVFAGIVARNRGNLSKDKFEDLNRRLFLKSVTVFPRPEHLDVPSLFEAMKKDKKRTGEGLALVMMKTDHSMVRVADMTREELEAGVKELREILSGAEEGKPS